MRPDQLRVALFSGNYNYVRDGANQSLNLLADYLLRQGVALRVYSPTTDTPAFEPTGDLVSVPSVAIPGRDEYRLALKLTPDVRADLDRFNPDIVHVSSPDFVAQAAVKYARKRGIPAVASFHTRFETYLRYYGLGWLEKPALGLLANFYRKLDAVFAPSPSMADFLKAHHMNDDVRIWSRGINQTIFRPDRRDVAWRRALGLTDDVPVIGFLSRLVLEKGLDVVAATMAELDRQGVKHRLLLVGDGPARSFIEERVPDAVFAGHLMGEDLGRAVASMDVFLFPSVTETFGNVTLEAMACALPVVVANASGSRDIVSDGIDGRVIQPGDIAGFAAACRSYCEDPALRRQHGQAGLAKSRGYSWDDVNKAMLDGYLDIIDRRSRG